MEHKNPVPRTSLFKKLKDNGGTSVISISELVSENKNVIVVDGQNFYGLYIYPKFDWVYGNLTELPEIVSSFVNPFTKAGIKLVFVMTDGHLDEGKVSLGGEQWLEDHHNFAQYAVHFYNELKKPKCNIRELKERRNYYNTPFHALSVVTYILRDVLNCEVRLVYPGRRCDQVVKCAEENKCLALLCEDKTYLFYKRTPYLLSLRNLNLKTMETILYDPKVLPRIFGIPEQYLYKPIDMLWEEKETIRTFLEILEKFLNEIKNETFVLFKHKFLPLNYLKKKPVEFIYSDDCEDDCDENNEINCTIGKNTEDNPEDKANGNATNVNNLDSKDLDSSQLTTGVVKNINSASTGSSLERQLHPIEVECVRFNIGYQCVTPCGPLQKWEFIKQKSKELYGIGKMNRRINILLTHEAFLNDSILEDFKEPISSSWLFIPLRKRLYGVLFHEADENFPEIIREFLISNQDWRIRGILPKRLETKTVILHPGLLTLWDYDNISDDAITKKWELFTESISSNLNLNLLRSLPPTLVVPSVVLFYLCHLPGKELKCNEHSDNRVKIMETWEAEVFIAQAVMLQKNSVRNNVCRKGIKEYNARVIKLIALFAYGCQMVQYYLEVCGNVISKSDMCLLHFFDGKLYQSIYEKALWRRRADFFCDEDVLENFNIMKRIILPESNFFL